MRLKPLFPFVLVLAMATPAQATVSCPGVVTRVSMEPGGELYAEWGYGKTRLCLLDQTPTVYRGANNTDGTTITPKRCDAIYTLFLSALSTQKQVVVYVNRSDCAMMNTTSTWGLPNPFPTEFFILTQ